MINFINLTKTYSNAPAPAVDNVNLTVNDGEIFGFLGPNGAGKTTTLKMLTGILPISYGSITINGFDMATQPIEAKKSIGYVPDDHLVYEQLSGREYINFLADIYGVSLDDRKLRAQYLLEKFSLTKDFDSRINTYSHGMKQKIAVIGALIHNPKIWVLDEPLTGLDPQSAFELKTLMREHADAGNIVLFSTHILEVAEKICDRLAIIQRGKIIAEGKLKDIKKNSDASLEEVFLKLTGSDESTRLL